MNKYLVIIVLITLISQTQCGLIKGLFGAIKNTTNAIKQDIRGVVHYGKTLVFGNNINPNDANSGETERKLPSLGLIDNISLKVHDVAAAVREHVRTAIGIFDKDESGNGLIGGMFIKMKKKLIKVKGFFLGNNKAQNQNKQNETLRPTREITVLSEKLKQYVFKHNSSTNTGLQQTLHSLTEVLDQLRNNLTKHRPNEEENDGTGLIDVRLAVDDLVGNSHDVNERIGKEIGTAHNKIDEQINKTQGKVTSSVDDLKRMSNNMIDNQRIYLQDEYNRLKIDGNDFKNNVVEVHDRLGVSVDNVTVKSFTNAYSAVN